jgi:TRAP-type C4-dicarboxylate transport system substrate-binding protein
MERAMKKFIIAIAILSFVSVFSISCKPQKAAEITLSYSIFFPPAHEQCKTAVLWAKEIEEKTNGRVKINLYPGGTLVKANETYDGVIKGIADIGMSCFAYTRGRFPVMEAVDLPMGYPSGTVATNVAHQYFKRMNPDELKGVKVLYIHAHGPGLLHTKKPVKTLAELKGLKIRSTGLSSKVVKALDAVPVAMSQGETYEALQKGVVEGTFAPIETLKGWKQAEVIKYTTDCRDIGYTTAMFVVMNLKKWESMPDDIKKVFTETSEKWVDMHAKTWDMVDREGREYSLKQGNSIIELSPEENSKWVESVQPVIRDYIKSVTAKGINGEEAVAILKELIAEFSSEGK